MNDDLLKWLLNSDPWIEYGTKTELMGQSESDPGIDVISRKMMEHISEDGSIKLPMNISKSYGGTGSDTWGWAFAMPRLIYMRWQKSV